MSEPAPTPSPPFSYKQFNTIVDGLELIYSIGKRLSNATQNRRCEYLIQEASTAFAKALLSLLGLLRFIPSSRYYADAGEKVIDLSSASVMARQVMEDAISVFYLAELNLTSKEKSFRRAVWILHGDSESMGVARFGNISHPERTPAMEAKIKRLRECIAKHPMFAQLASDLDSRKSGRPGRIKKGAEGHILHDNDILSRRGIELDVYNMGRKVLSNFAHFSTLSHKMMMETSGDWQKSWRNFLSPVLYALNFAAEALEVYLAVFPDTDQLITAQEKAAILNCRSWLRSTFEQRIVGTRPSK